MKKISVITINYNNGHGLEKTIKSVVEQEFVDFEFIVIDGGSTDNSTEVIEKFGDKITYWISEKDSGIYNAQNKGIKKATGDYCLFLNSGDTLIDKEVLKKVYTHLNNVDILYGNIFTVSENGVRNGLKSPQKIDVYEMMISTLWHPSAFIKRALFNRFGLYDESFKITGDYEFFIRTILKRNAKTIYVDLDIALFDLSGISNDNTSNELQTLERKKSWELNFSKIVIEAFEDKTRILRSREYKIAKLINKVKSPFLKKK